MDARCERHDQAIVRLETKVDFIVDTVKDLKEHKKSIIEEHWKVIMLIVALASFLVPVVLKAVVK